MSGWDFSLEHDLIPKLVAQLPDFVDKALAATALEVETDAKREVPVGTPESTGIPGYHGGRLRASGHTKRNSATDYEVVFSTNYALFVHEGTRRMRARKFLLNAVNKNQAKLIERFKALEGFLH
jgi:HK97 gp10 family phage protein